MSATSASLIGCSGSSTFRLSTATVSMPRIGTDTGTDCITGTGTDCLIGGDNTRAMQWLSRSTDHAPDAKSTARRLRSASELDFHRSHLVEAVSGFFTLPMTACPPSFTWTCSTRTYCCPPLRKRASSLDRLDYQPPPALAHALRERRKAFVEREIRFIRPCKRRAARSPAGLRRRSSSLADGNRRTALTSAGTRRGLTCESSLLGVRKLRHCRADCNRRLRRYLDLHSQYHRPM
jgi:hypothetical protein